MAAATRCDTCDTFRALVTGTNECSPCRNLAKVESEILYKFGTKFDTAEKKALQAHAEKFLTISQAEFHRTCGIRMSIATWRKYVKSGQVGEYLRRIAPDTAPQ